jgi:hypothetical protein
MSKADDFDKWWGQQGQTIGIVAARAAWDFQQQRIAELEAKIERLKGQRYKIPINEPSGGGSGAGITEGVRK